MLRAEVAASSRRIAALEQQAEELRALVASLREQLAERDALLAKKDGRIAELAAEIDRLKRKGYKPQPSRQSKPKSAKQDRRTKRHRTHPGQFRDAPSLEDVPPDQLHEHEVKLAACPCCGSEELHPTGFYDDHIVVDIPEPKLEYHRYRRYEFACAACGKKSKGRGDLELPGSHIGPRARLLNIYCRAHLGVSLGKSRDLLGQWWGLSLSRAGALGHLAWGGKLFEPVVAGLLDLLRQSNTIHGDETGWRINGKNVWCWCLSNPDVAVYLIKHSRGSDVLREALGDSLPGVLVCDFYAAYNCLSSAKQRCLVHLLRELHAMRDKAPPICVKTHVQPLMELFQDAIELGRRRETLSPEAYNAQCDDIYERFGDLATAKSANRDITRILKRLNKYVDELFTFLETPGVPSDNTPCERDIRSVAAARADGGVNRTDWGARAFANAKSIIRTCQKQGRQFLDYGLHLIRANASLQPTPLPLANVDDSS